MVELADGFNMVCNPLQGLLGLANIWSPIVFVSIISNIVQVATIQRLRIWIFGLLHSEAV